VDSSISTFVQDSDVEEDRPSIDAMSACASSQCLFPPDELEKIDEAEVEPPMEEAAPERLRLQAGAFRVQKPEGCCEDSYFFSPSSLGVADGVGQMADFAKHGVDAAQYAADLMELAGKALLRDGCVAEEASSHAAQERAMAALRSADAEATSYGATTVTVLVLQGTSVGVANLGDSGFMLLRGSSWGLDIVTQSREQHHGWNQPYQLTRIPQSLRESNGRNIRLDSVADCQAYEAQVQPGDLLLLFTDGLTDNLHWYEILRVINDQIERQQNAQLRVPPSELAEAVVVAAQERSTDRTADTPFARNARRMRINVPGGKTDDITVVAAWVAPSGINSSSETKVVTVGCPHDANLSEKIECDCHDF
jgi:protein phosphatase PTC7